MTKELINVKVVDISRTDITDFSEDELSLLVFNDEDLYKSRRKRNFIGILREQFIFTDEQLEVLKQDLKEDSEEE